MVIWFGIGETSKILLIHLAIFAPVAMSALAGVKSAQQVRVRCRTVAGSQPYAGAVVCYFAGGIAGDTHRVAYRAWRGLVDAAAAELTSAATRGLGFMVQSAGEFLATDVVLAGIAVIAVIAFILELGLRALQRRLTPWHGEVQ